MHIEMHSIGKHVLVLAATALLWSTTIGVQAYSTEWPAITRSEHIINLRHDILPRKVTFGARQDQPLARRSVNDLLDQNTDIISRHDTVRLQFTAYNTTFHLYLEPNKDLIHPNANLGEGVSLDDIKAFKGIVILDDDHSDRKWNLAATTTKAPQHSVEHMLHENGVVGWARMMVEHDTTLPETILLHGAFSVDGDTYHVKSQQHYRAQKRADDAMPFGSASAVPRSSMVVYRDSDLYHSRSTLRKKKRGLDTDNDVHTCGSDKMLPKTPSFLEAASNKGHYYPPDFSEGVPMTNVFELNSPWRAFAKSPLVKRAPGPNPVPSGCPTNRLVTYMGVAADCSYVRSYKGQAGARIQMFADFNTASRIYESTFNVALGIIELKIMPESCPTTPAQGEEWNRDCTDGYGIDQRLSDFSRWRGQGDRANDGAGLWHLMTRCNMGSVVGIAWTKMLCQMKASQQGAQWTSGTGVSSVTPNEWMVVAHEIGHGFGAIHDCNAQTCAFQGGNDCCPLSSSTCDAGGRYIMNPSEQGQTQQFSSCSIQAICGTIQGPSGQCLKPPGTRETQSSDMNICGNGLKESGEDCDCGSPESCAKDPCCDGATCKFKAGAICDDLNDDCCLNCQLRPAGQVCRQAISECDIQEVCSGTSANCPVDVRVPNLTECKGPNNATGLQCANGACTSRDLQCQQQDRQGVTKQCGASNSCQLMCNDPGGNPLSCVQIPGVYFLDGTPCGFGGTCSGGSCSYSNGINGVLDWARNHLTIVIPVACVVGLILLCCIWSCCSSLCRRRQLKKPPVYRPPNSGRARNGNAIAPGAGRVQQSQQHSQRHSQQQQFPMQPIPPAPVYYDPSHLSGAAHQPRNREEEDMQRAIEESRREYERQSRFMPPTTDASSAPNNTQTAGMVVPPISNQRASFIPAEGLTPPVRTSTSYSPQGTTVVTSMPSDPMSRNSVGHGTSMPFPAYPPVESTPSDENRRAEKSLTLTAAMPLEGPGAEPALGSTFKAPGPEPTGPTTGMSTMPSSSMTPTQSLRMSGGSPPGYMPSDPNAMPVVSNNSMNRNQYSGGQGYSPNPFQTDFGGNPNQQGNVNRNPFMDRLPPQPPSSSSA